jgi:RimJ/RimL family protein N-acetyltransferase
MLSGKFVGLRAIEKSDLEQLLAWRNRPEYRRYFREYRELGTDAQNFWFQNIATNDPKTMMFAIEELNTGRLLGAAGLCYIDWINRNADFSLYIGADNLYIDSKYAPDAARTMITYAFGELCLHRLWSEIYDFDEPKKKLFSELEFTLDGRHKQTHWAEGKWCDSLFYGLLAPDWRK